MRTQYERSCLENANELFSSEKRKDGLRNYALPLPEPLYLVRSSRLSEISPALNININKLHKANLVEVLRSVIL